MEIPQKTKNRITIWSGNHTPGHISRRKYNSKRYLHPCVHSRTIHYSQDLKTTWISIDWLVGKEDMVHIFNGILLSQEKEWANAVCGNRNAARDYHTKWSKSERERQHMMSLIYVDSKMWHKWICLWNRVINTESRLVVANRE